MIKKLPFLVLALTLAITSCDKKKDETPAPQETNEIKAKMDGADWSASTTDAIMANGTISIVGKGSDGSQLTIGVWDTIPGTYMVTPNSTHTGTYTATEGSLAYTSNGSSTAGGTIVITSIDKEKKRMKGTFSFKVVKAMDNSSKNFTEGTFDVAYGTSFPTTPGKTLTAKIGTEVFTATTVGGYVSAGTLTISGTTGGTKTMGLVVPANVSAGTYDLTMFGSYRGMYSPDGITTYMSESGKITITSHNVSGKKIEGTFYFTAKDFNSGASATITAGTFSTTY